MFNKLQAYKQTLAASGQSRARLYFVKVDVQAAFDTIPQGAIQDLIASLLSENEYIVKRHTEVKPPDTHGRHNESAFFKPVRKFCAEAQIDSGLESFVKAIEAKPMQIRRHNTVYVDNVVTDELRRAKMLQLLGEHVGANVIRIGKKFYRQKKGIPQGSVLSSLLCNIFYADFEAKHLRFLQNDQSLLMRLIDDFLLVTTRKDLAIRFLQTMRAGNEEYGITVKSEKSLINFEATIASAATPQIESDVPFPYCGIFLDQSSLNISKDYSGKSVDSTYASFLPSCPYSSSTRNNQRWSHGRVLPHSGSEPATKDHDHPEASAEYDATLHRVQYSPHRCVELVQLHA
jgi:telomerase reverse transcriptase